MISSQNVSSSLSVLKVEASFFIMLLCNQKQFFVCQGETQILLQLEGFLTDIKFPFFLVWSCFNLISSRALVTTRAACWPQFKSRINFVCKTLLMALAFLAEWTHKKDFNDFFASEIFKITILIFKSFS